MANKCFAMLRGHTLRATRLDNCGRVIDSECSSRTTDGFITVAFTANVNTPDAITVTNARGAVCVSDTPPSEFSNFGINATFCQVDPELYAMFTNQEVEYDSAGDAVGFRVASGVRSDEGGVALELWSTVPGEACSDDPNAQGSYGYMISPFVQGGTIGDFTLENGAVTFSINNMQTKDGAAWGSGPYDVVLVDGDPAPLERPLGAKDHFLARWTQVAPPEAGCACESSGPAPTTATAGEPGTWGPEGAYAPASLSTLQNSDVTADPVTAWTTGQYMVLGDDSHAYWDGSAWVAGEAS